MCLVLQRNILPQQQQPHPGISSVRHVRRPSCCYHCYEILWAFDHRYFASPGYCSERTEAPGGHNTDTKPPASRRRLLQIQSMVLLIGPASLLCTLDTIYLRTTIRIERELMALHN